MRLISCANDENSLEEKCASEDEIKEFALNYLFTGYVATETIDFDLYN